MNLSKPKKPGKGLDSTSRSLSSYKKMASLTYNATAYSDVVHSATGTTSRVRQRPLSARDQNAVDRALLHHEEKQYKVAYFRNEIFLNLCELGKELNIKRKDLEFITINKLVDSLIN